MTTLRSPCHMGALQRGQHVAFVLQMADTIRKRTRPRRNSLREVALLIMSETGCSRATGFRWAGEFVDALGIELAPASEQARMWSRRTKKSPDEGRPGRGLSSLPRRD